MRDVYIAGVGQTPVSRGPGPCNRQLGAEAVRRALGDAGLDAARVDALYVGNMMSGILAKQQQLGGLIAEYAGLQGVEAFSVEAACASGGAAMRMGYLAVAGGLKEAVVVCGVERMTDVDRETVTRALATATDWEVEGACGESFLSLNAGLMRAYMHAYDKHPEDFAPFAITAHRNAMANPNALLRRDIDLDDYVDSRVVVEPLRLFDASPICDGAAAVVLVAADVEPRRPRGPGPRIRVSGSAVATDTLALARRRDRLRLDAVAASTATALEQAGLRHADIGMLELHDAYTIMSVLSLESGGFAAPGEATALGRDGSLELRGALPISTMGGLKARGHPVGASGIYQVADAHAQLSGLAGQNQIDAPVHALVQSIGGTGATVVTHVLSRED